jgi:hypothetical protein
VISSQGRIAASFLAAFACASCPAEIALNCASARPSALSSQLSSYRPAQQPETKEPRQNQEQGRSLQLSSRAFLKSNTGKMLLRVTALQVLPIGVITGWLRFVTSLPATPPM